MKAKGSFKGTFLRFSGRMIEMILITLGFILLGSRPVGIGSLIFLLALLGLFVAQFIYFQRRKPRNNDGE